MEENQENKEFLVPFVKALVPEVDLKNKKTPYPITEEQLISLFELLSELAQKYKIDKNFIGYSLIHNNTYRLSGVHHIPKIYH